jgi:Spy/CpxP family protein refolding chaperone
MKFKAAALVFSVFLTGAIVGGLAVHVFGDRIWASDSSTRLSKNELLQQLSRDLNLNPEQRAQIDSIMNGTLSDYNRILAPLSPQLEQVRQQGRQRIRAILTSDQLPKFDAFIRHLDEQRSQSEQRAQQPKPAEQK